MGSRPEEVRAQIADAVGKECWSVLVSESGDDVLVLDLGEKQRRSLRLSNPSLSFVQRTYEGEFSFLVECPWRLDGNEGVVATSLDDDRAHGVRARKLKVIEGRRLAAVAVENAGYDLALSFDGGYVLRCFAALAAKKATNWTFSSPDVRVTIFPFGRAETESRRALEKRLFALKRAIRGDEGDVVATFLRARGLEKVDEEVVDRAPAPLIPISRRGAAEVKKPARKKRKTKPAKKPRPRR